MKDTSTNEILITGMGSGHIADGEQDGSSWPLPFLLAVGLHTLVLVLAFFSPSWFTKPKKIDVVSIDLVNIGSQIAAPPGPPAAGPPAPKPMPPAPKPAAPAPPAPAPAPPPREASAPIPAPPPKPVDVAPPPPPPPQPSKPVEAVKPSTPAVPHEVISIAPDKAKKVVKKDTKVEEKNLSSAIAAIQKKVEKDTKVEKVEEKDLSSAITAIQKRIEADRAGKTADEKARRAVEFLRDRLASGQASSDQQASPQNRPQGGANGTAATPGGGGGGGTPTALGQYYAQLIGHLRQFYQLPPGQNFEPGLKAIIKITIAKDGKLQDISFEKKSGNVYFDRFVERAFKSSSPVPPLPPILGIESLGPLGINCYPNELI